MRKHVTSSSPFENSIGFSRAVRLGNTIHVSGTAPINPDGSTNSPGDVYLQTRRCLEIMAKAIRDLDAKLTDVVRTRIYLKNINSWEQAAKAHGEYFSNVKPACTFVEVSGFIKAEWLVEIEAYCQIEN